MRSPLHAFTGWQRLAWLLPLYAFAIAPLHAAPNDAPPAVNLLSNPGFETPSRPVDNTWDGVDSDGYLAGFKYNAMVVSERGSLSPLAMPPSVAFADLNGDGKPDLITCDPSGYFRFYPNRGTATEPHFTTAEIVPIYLSISNKPREHGWRGTILETNRMCPRFALADWRRSGLLDLLVGNYTGETYFVPNVGNVRQPIYRQPSGPTGGHLPTSEKQPLWGNLLSPAAADIDHNGQLDLLLGEGTYSANSIHLWRNTSSTGVPKFTDAQHTQIAYGDGREQLIPTAVDYDGDGNVDLIVADRTGEVGVYLNPGKSQPPGSEFKRASTLSFGGRSKLPGLCSVCAADYNGDGLFDLILGMSTGHIAVALNTGTKTAPTFGPTQELKGEDRFGRNVNTPEGWTPTTSIEYGNALGYISVVDAKEDPASQPPEGAHCLKAAYWPLGGDTFQVPPEGIPGAHKHFYFTKSGLTFNNNKAYELSFKVKGAAMEKLHYSIFSRYYGLAGQVKVDRGERGEIKNKGDLVEEYVDIGADFKLGSSWTPVTGTLNIQYRSPALRDQPTMPGTLYIDFWATSTASVLYLDDFKLIQK